MLLFQSRVFAMTRVRSVPGLLRRESAPTARFTSTPTSVKGPAASVVSDNY